MSGGVDSSVAAALLVKQGYDVVGIFMKLWAETTDRTDLVRENVCCSVEASTAARAVAEHLGIPFYVVNFQEEFKKTVVDYYVSEYEKGRTPNPCVICNRDIKGEILMRKVLDLKGDYLATGHYAKIEEKKDGYHFYKGIDQNKDQTYFLWTLNQEKLSRLLFPVGGMIKPDVRRLALKMKLPTAERKESQGICFIPDRDVCGFLHRHAKKLTKTGNIIDAHGKKLGLHDGLINYTIGQRERLGLGGPTAHYVVELDSKKNILIVSSDDDLYHKRLTASDVNWLRPVGDAELGSNLITAKIRYGHPDESCKVKETKDGVEVEFSSPQRAITPGQSIVFYLGDEVLGGAVIEKIKN